MREIDVRQRLVEALEADLIGPFVPDSHPQGGQEVLPIAPSRWYLTGFLAPQGGRAPDAVVGVQAERRGLSAECCCGGRQQSRLQPRPVVRQAHHHEARRHLGCDLDSQSSLFSIAK